MRPVVDRGWLAGVPLLLVSPPARGACLPTVLWLHGLGADKDVHLPELLRLAEAGFLAVGFDAVGHGERRAADCNQPLPQSPGEAPALFDRLVTQTVFEVSPLIDALVACGLSDRKRIGIAGVSMGACIVYGCVAADQRLGAAVAIMGSPEPALPDWSAVARAQGLPTALLSITAELDTIVPPAAAKALHEQLLPGYHRVPERLDYRSLVGTPHFMSAEDWVRTVGEAVAWLSRFLR
mgnify:CR=1 FL=1